MVRSAVTLLLVGAAGCGAGGAAGGGAGGGAGGAGHLDVAASPRLSPPSAPAPSATARGGLVTSFHTATGAVAAYDAAGRVLVLRSAGGELRFRVAPGAQVWVGTRHARLDRLVGSAGAQATVAWSEDGGVPTTHTVRLARSRADGDR